LGRDRIGSAQVFTGQLLGLAPDELSKADLDNGGS
jgi:hypothetical protein